MSNTTRWKDTSETKLESVIERISNSPQRESDAKEYGNVRVQSNYAGIQKGVFNDNEIEYTSLNVTYEYYVPHGEEVTTRVNSVFIIAYKENRAISYIIDKNSGAQKLLRFLMGYTGRGEIISDPAVLSSNFLIWLISKVYLGEAVYDVADGIKIDVESIIGFRGNTADSISTVSATGDSVMNTLGTLGFLLDSKTFTQEQVRLSYGKHRNVELKFGTTSKGVIEADSKSYIGEYRITGSKDYEVNDRLYLLSYLEIIPTLIQWYTEEKQEDSGGQSQIEFLEQVTDDITKRIEETKERLKTK